MKRMTYLDEEQRVIDFTKRAAECFANENIWTYTDSGDITAGELFAMRWGLGADCVLVFRIDENFVPINFQQAIRKGE